MKGPVLSPRFMVGAAWDPQTGRFLRGPESSLGRFGTIGAYVIFWVGSSTTARPFAFSKLSPP